MANGRNCCTWELFAVLAWFGIGLYVFWLSWWGHIPQLWTIILPLLWLALMVFQVTFISRACCRPRIEFGDDEKDVSAFIYQVEEEMKPLDSTTQGKRKGFRGRLKKVLSDNVDFFNFSEAKTEKVNGKERKYIEKKFPVINQSPFAKNTKALFRYMIDNRSAWGLMLLAVIIATAKWNPDWEESTSAAVSTYLTAFAALFSVLISLLFSNGIEKNKENKRLFQALCGDIKALAMYACALTNDINKYTIKHENNNNNLPIESIRKRGSVEAEFAKLRYLLAVVAPVAKHVLRQAPNPNKACYDKLDDKYRIRVYVPRGRLEWLCIKTRICNVGFFKGFQCIAPRLEQDYSNVWKIQNPKKNKDGNALKYYLYKKIRYLMENTKMDLFEVVMYCILDQINDMRERSALNRDQLAKDVGSRIRDGRKESYDIIDSYSKERDLIAKYQHIYASWGTMYSLTTYDQPAVVHLTIVFSLVLYTYGLAGFNINEANKNWAGSNPDPGAPDWSAEPNVTDTYIILYVIVKTVLQIIPFTWFWFLSRSIGKPFKKGYPDATIISKDARDTQEQVSKLMSVRPQVDACDQLDFDISREDMLTAINRRSIGGDKLLYGKKRGGKKGFLGKDDELEQEIQIRLGGRSRKNKRGSIRFSPDKEASVIRNIIQDIKEEEAERKAKEKEERDAKKRASAGDEDGKKEENYQPKKFKVRYKNVNF